MWDDMAVVDLCTTHDVLLAIIGAMVDRVSFLIHRGSVLKRARISLCTLSLLVVAGCPWVRTTTRPVNHDLFYYLEELWLSFRVRPVRMDTGIDVVGGVEFLTVFKEDEEVHMRESSFLELDGIYPCNNSTEDPIFDDVIKKGISFQPKDSSDQVRTIRGLLPREQLLLNLQPLWICRHGDEEVDLFKIPSNRHGVLKDPVHVLCATDVRRR